MLAALVLGWCLLFIVKISGGMPHRILAITIEGGILVAGSMYLIVLVWHMQPDHVGSVLVPYIGLPVGIIVLWDRHNLWPGPLQKLRHTALTAVQYGGVAVSAFVLLTGIIVMLIAMGPTRYTEPILSWCGL